MLLVGFVFIILGFNFAGLSEDEVQYQRLEELVKSHDVCFALTDSREARWVL